MSRKLLFLLAAAPLAFGQARTGPFLYLGGATNSASFMPQALPGGGIARGSVFTITGEGLGPDEPVEATRLPFATTLANVSLTLTQGRVTTSAWPVYVSPTQVNAIMPSTLAAGAYSLRVRVGDRTSNPIPVRVSDAGPGIFTQNGAGTGPAVAAGVSLANRSPLSSAKRTRDLRPGQVASLWMTGLGPVTRADNQPPAALDTANRVEAWVGGKAVPTRVYAGRVPAVPGIDQFIFVIPDDAPTGCFVPVQVRVNGQFVSNTATLPITHSGTVCRDEFPALTAQVQSDKLALLLYRNTMGERTQDVAIARTAQPAAFDPYLAAPPSGACTTYHITGSFLRTDLDGRPVDFGDISVDNGTVRQALTALAGLPGYFAATLKDLLGDESVSVSTSGSANRPAVNERILPPPRLRRSSLAETATVDSARPLNLSWQGEPGVRVSVLGIAHDLPTNATTLFACTASAEAESFTVPAYILANLPTSRTQTSHQAVYLGLGAANASDLETAADGQTVIGLKSAASVVWQQVQLRTATRGN